MHNLHFVSIIQNLEKRLYMILQSTQQTLLHSKGKKRAAENQKQYIQKAELIETENQDMYYIYVENRQWIESIYASFPYEMELCNKNLSRQNA